MQADILIPDTYTTSPDAHIRITNYPESAEGVAPILVVTLNRPDKLNAFTGDMISRLENIFLVTNLDDRVKAIVLTGAGSAFSAGIDLSIDIRPLTNIPPGEMRDTGGKLALAMYNSTKTIIVAYNGLSVGIGMTSTLAAAIRIASPKSKFGFPFSRIGLTMESASSFFLPRMVGHSSATYLLTTGLMYPADFKLLDGVFAELVAEPKDVLPRALELAQEITTGVSAVAAHLNRQLIWRSPATAEEAHLVDSPLLGARFASKDHAEAKRAFFKKEKPKFAERMDQDAPVTYPWWTEVAVNTKPKAVRTSGSKL